MSKKSLLVLICVFANIMAIIPSTYAYVTDTLIFEYSIDSDYRDYGNLYSEDELVAVLAKNANANTVVFQGQQHPFSYQTTITSPMMLSLKRYLPNLTTIHLEGWTHVQWYASNSQYGDTIENMLPTTIAPIHTTDFPKVSRLIFVNTLIENSDLESLPRNFKNLEEIHLIGCEKISDKGIIALVSHSPKLRHIYLGSIQYSIGRGEHKWTAQNISSDTLEIIKMTGIDVRVENQKSAY